MNNALASLVNLVFEVFSFLILVEVIGSWVLVMRVRIPNWAYNLLSAIHNLTAPILDPIRRLVPAIGGLDLSPLIALVLLDVLRRVVVTALLRM